MSTQFRWLIVIVLQVLVLYFIIPKIKGIRVSKNWIDSLMVVLLFLGLNFLIRSFFYKITFGLVGVLYYLTFGILGLILNAAILMLISKFLPEKIKVEKFSSALFAGFLLALVNFLV